MRKFCSSLVRVALLALLAEVSHVQGFATLDYALTGNYEPGITTSRSNEPNHWASTARASANSKFLGHQRGVKRESPITSSAITETILFLSTRNTSTEQQQQKTKATLTDETTWKVRIQMNNVPTTQGRRVDPLFVFDLQFMEDVNYEPPQGTVKQVNNINGSSTSSSTKTEKDDGDDNDTSAKEAIPSMLQINKGRWQLSEDPNDRKDGLWVWGLFQEPLYPFFLLTLETSEISLSGNDSIAPLKLFCQVSHQREDTLGAVLGTGTLNIREIETVQADPFGGATVDIYEEVGIGQISFVPVS